MKTLIIGAGGLLGRPVVSELSRRGHDLRLFSRNVNNDMFANDYEIVNGDVMDRHALQKAIKGCEAIHVSLSNVDEVKAMEGILELAGQENIKLISLMSGCTVAEENRWFPMIDNKFRTEQALMQSGIPYMIFRGTWFFESLELMVRNGKASIIGDQKHPYHWTAAADYARMLGTAYEKEEARNRIFYPFGEKIYLMQEVLSEYCAVHHPEIKKVTRTPIGVLKMIAWVTRNKTLRFVADMFRYFEKTPERGDPQETWKLLGKPQISFHDWLNAKD